ncbi:MAG: hypothetical protein MUD12_16400 [Spirochaetes bacterium]|jgi:hypothetical protein|nr:hypothetical protein [Spirochaetota bacterium]
MERVTVELFIQEGCCIECAAKREYNRLFMRIMEGIEHPGSCDESRMDLLLDFLKQSDFSALRASDEGLSGMKSSHCVLERNSNGMPCLSIINTE